jgi:hypothetical protein
VCRLRRPCRKLEQRRLIGLAHFDSPNHDNTGKNINAACAAIANNEYVNFAFIQTDGVPFPAGSPSPLGPPVSTNANSLLMNRIRHAAHRVRHNPTVPTAPVEPRG